MLISLSYLESVVEVIMVNLVLSGDNALVIALVARGLPASQRCQALALGGASAVLAQLGFTLAVSHVMRVPGLRLLGALLLAWIACRLLRDETQDITETHPALSLRTAVIRIILVNLAMSLDNVIAVAAVGGGDPVRLTIGLLVSAAVIIGFSTLVLRWIARFRWLVYAGAAVLAFTAAGMMWKDLGPALIAAHPVALLGMGVVATQTIRWAFKALVVSTCLFSPRWWPRISLPET